MNMQQENQKHDTNSASGHPLSVGNTLREARERLDLNVNDVANRIKFAPRQIEALEADDYARLPEAAFVRGFVRSYARFLGLDPVPLLSSLPSSHTQASSAHEIKSVEIPMPSVLSARRHNIIWLAAALVIALSLAIFVRTHDRAPEKIESAAKANVQALELPDKPAETASAQLPEQVPSVESLPVQAAPEAPVPEVHQSVEPKIIRSVPTTPTSPQSVQAAPVLPPQPSAQPKVVRSMPFLLPWQAAPQKPVRVVPAPAPAPPQAPVIDAGIKGAEHSLRLEFDEDAWLEIKEGNDKILLSRKYPADSLVRVTGKAPLLVVIGNARAVRLFDNGKKVNLERYTTAEVAKVKLK